MPRHRLQNTTLRVISRPNCPRCDARMRLARIEPDKPGYDLRTFECGSCGHSTSIIAKID